MIRYELKNFPPRRVVSDVTKNLAEMPLLRLPEYTHTTEPIFLINVVPDRAHDTDGRSSVDSTESRWFLVSEKKRKPRVSREVADDL